MLNNALHMLNTTMLYEAHITLFLFSVPDFFFPELDLFSSHFSSNSIPIQLYFHIVLEIFGNS